MIESKIRIKHNRKLNCKVKQKITQKNTNNTEISGHTKHKDREKKTRERKKAQHRNHYWSL